MNNTWLLIDANNLASQSYYAMGGAMTHGDIATGVVFGFLRDICNLMQTHKTNNIAFCFDLGKPLRCKLLPTYKANRKPESTQNKEHRSERNRQINLLRTDYLPEIGFRNVFSQQGYEADDIIAGLAPFHDSIIVSSDHDLYQCLSRNVMIWNRGKSFTWNHLYLQYGIKNAKRWADVKAIAGCSSDNIPGVPGVGEKTAIKFLTGNLKQTTKAWADIQANHHMTARNLKLVTLPFTGTVTPTLVKDEVSTKSWDKFVSKLGMKSLVGAYPTSYLPTLF